MENVREIGNREERQGEAGRQKERQTEGESGVMAIV